jgi:plastocyanin
MTMRALLLGAAFVVLTAGAVRADGGATVSGVVKFKGTKPARKPADAMLGNPFCKEALGGKAPLEDKFVFGKNGKSDTLGNVLVYVSKGLEGKKFDPPKEPAVLDQAACAYTPHVIGVMVGQKLEVRNSDATLHNVMTRPRENRAFNEGMPTKGTKLEKVFTKPELKVDFRCFMHPWMLAYVHVLEHPYYAITREDGSFTIKDLPPGEYELSVIHESSQLSAEPATAKVKVAAGETKRVDFAFK